GIGTVAQSEFFYACQVDASFFKIRQAYGFTFVVIEQKITEPFGGKLIDDAQAFFSFYQGFLLFAMLGFFKFNFIKIGQPTDGFREIIFLVFLNEGDHVSAFATAKTFKKTFGRADGKRRGFLVVERTVGDVVAASFFEGDELPDHFAEVGAIQDGLYGLLSNQNKWRANLGRKKERDGRGLVFI